MREIVNVRSLIFIESGISFFVHLLYGRLLLHVIPRFVQKFLYIRYLAYTT